MNFPEKLKMCRHFVADKKVIKFWKNVRVSVFAFWIDPENFTSNMRTVDDIIFKIEHYWSLMRKFDFLVAIPQEAKNLVNLTFASWNHKFLHILQLLLKYINRNIFIFFNIYQNHWKKIHKNCCTQFPNKFFFFLQQVKVKSVRIVLLLERLVFPFFSNYQHSKNFVLGIRKIS